MVHVEEEIKLQRVFLDERFKAVDQRLEQMQKTMDTRFASLKHNMDKRFEAGDKRFERFAASGEIDPLLGWGNQLREQWLTPPNARRFIGVGGREGSRRRRLPLQCSP